VLRVIATRRAQTTTLRLAFEALSAEYQVLRTRYDERRRQFKIVFGQDPPDGSAA